jgi:hypothetical protein
MSEPHKDHSPTKSPETATLDPTSASAALAQAVTSAEKSGGKTATAEPAKIEPAKTEAAKIEAAKTEAVKTSVPLHKKWPSPAPEWRRHAPHAVAMALAIGLGWAGGSQAVSGAKQAMPAMPEWIEAAASGIRETQENVVRLTGDVRILKGIVEAMKESLDQAKAEAAGRQRALLERVEASERAAQDAAAKIAHIAETSGRIERASTDAGAKLAALSGSLDDIERHTKAAAAKPAASAAIGDGPAQTGSVPEPKVPAKDMPLEGWVLRDVYAGVALVESRGGRLHEVVPGTRLPNVGRVEAIERRGRTWVVVTQKGIIGAPERWQ